MAQRWFLDANFQVVADAAGADLARDQDYSTRLVYAFRTLRNSLAHGEVILDPNLGWAFMAVRDLIIQLYPVDLLLKT